ncbi:unnamed protein product [Oikopleura dioica]|uniref:Uncharacterized protein n=2 Tax=Oikopleura dioica TaxID=34765 RepID=E4YFF3_OIKDI|nr:unnamed protein product [Oikopleura dioica]
MEGVLGADFSVKHHWNLSQKLLELDSGNKLHQIIAKTILGDVDHLADFQKAEARFCENCFERCENHEKRLKIRTICKRKGRAKRQTKIKQTFTVQKCSACNFSRTSKLETRLNNNLAVTKSENLKMKNSESIQKGKKPSKSVAKKLNSMKAKAGKAKKNKNESKKPQNSLAGFLSKF